MPLSNILSRILLCLLLFTSTRLSSQCPPSIAAAACTGIEPSVVADEILIAGTTKWYSGSPVTLNSLTMRGGKLVVCGDLTIDKFYMDSGQIIINPGGRFVIGSGLGSGLTLKGSSSIYNYGTLEVQRNLSLEDGWSTPARPNIIVNATAASVFKMPNQYFVINNANSWFVNNGVSQFWGLITDNLSSPKSVCLGPESHMSMNTLINKVTNAYTVSSGGACVYVVQLSQFFGTLTNSPNLFACLAASHHSDTGCMPFGCTPNDWGAAKVVANCNTCSSLGVLPLQFTSLQITSDHTGNMVKWEMDMNAAAYMFYIERSADGKNFFSIDSLQGTYTKYFNYTDAFPQQGISYYRIRCTDIYSGSTVISKVVSTGISLQGNSKIYPSPFNRYFFVALPAGETAEKIMVKDINGIDIRVRWEKQAHQYLVTPLTAVAKQVLLVQIITHSGLRTERILSE